MWDEIRLLWWIGFEPRTLGNESQGMTTCLLIHLLNSATKISKLMLVFSNFHYLKP